MFLTPDSFTKEDWKCLSCNIPLQAESITKVWKCSKCSRAVTIYAVDYEGRKRVINRLTPSEVSEGCGVVVGNSFQYVRPVIAITKVNDGHRIALKEYRAVFCPPDELVTCVVGEW